MFLDHDCVIRFRGLSLLFLQFFFSSHFLNAVALFLNWVSFYSTLILRCKHISIIKLISIVFSYMTLKNYKIFSLLAGVFIFMIWWASVRGNFSCSLWSKNLLYILSHITRKWVRALSRSTIYWKKYAHSAKNVIFLLSQPKSLHMTTHGLKSFLTNISEL